jgi:integrase/recombinase XerD
VLYAAGETLEALRGWWEIRAAIDTEADHFFTTAAGAPIKPAYVRQMVRRLGERAGIPEEKRHPHALRHTFGTDLYRETRDIRLVQTAMGHGSVQTTQIYAHVSGADVETALRAFQGDTAAESQPKYGGAS